MYKKILVPLDGSQFGECSIEQLGELVAPGSGSKVVLLSVIETAMGSSMLSSELGDSWVAETTKKLKDGMDAYLSAMVERLQKKGISAAKVLTEGNAAESILLYATANKIDLIVMSTHGRSGVVKWAIGGVADKVLRQAQMPVLLVAPKACR